MKDKEKQIQEIAQIICGRSKDDICIIDNTSCDSSCCWARIAEAIYNVGYRKIPENSVVLSKKEYEVLKIKEEEKHWFETCMTVWKNAKIYSSEETAKKIYTKIKDSFLMNSNNRYALKLWIEEQFGLEIKE